MSNLKSDLFHQWVTKMFSVTVEFLPVKDSYTLIKSVSFHSLYECILLDGDNEFGGLEVTSGHTFHLLDFNKENFCKYI